MEKLSNEKVAELLTDASQTIRKYAAENKALKEKLAEKELRERAEKVASEMHTKGVRLDVPREELVDQLQKEALAGRLGEIERAVEMIGPDMGKFAQVNNTNDDQRNSPSSSELERYLVGGVG